MEKLRIKIKQTTGRLHRVYYYTYQSYNIAFSYQGWDSPALTSVGRVLTDMWTARAKRPSFESNKPL